MKGIKSRLARDTTKFAVVPLLLALAVVLIVMNIKHSMECLGSGEGADEAALKRQALEKRLLALEQEALENSILLEKFIRRLEDKFSLSKAAPISSSLISCAAAVVFPTPPIPFAVVVAAARRTPTIAAVLPAFDRTLALSSASRAGRV